MVGKSDKCLDDIPVNKIKHMNKLPKLIENIVQSCTEENTYAHIDLAMIPSRKKIIESLDLLRDIIFPGYFGNQELFSCNLQYHIGEEITSLFEIMSKQIYLSIKHDCLRYNRECINCVEEGLKLTLSFISKIPVLQKLLSDDVRAALNGDPAAKSPDEIIFAYPGLYAILVYRIAHELYILNVPLIPRIMTEYAHSITGIDIHPGAIIGNYLCIDHGTGIVIGETAVIGNRVKIYQGVTLGALSIKKSDFESQFPERRHPTIEDDVILYSNCTILGGKTTIGKNSIIGGNVWITESVPSETIVTTESTSKCKYKKRIQNDK